MTLRKKLALGLFALVSTASTVALASEACNACYNDWWHCKLTHQGFEDYCDIPLTRCLRRNSCEIDG